MKGDSISMGVDAGRHTVLRSADKDEIVAQVSRRLRPHGFHTPTPGPLSCVLAHVSLGGCAVSWLRYGQRVRVDGEPLDTCYLIGVPLRGRAHYRHDGQQTVARPGVATVLSTREPFTIDMDHDYEQVILRLDRHVVENARDAAFGAHVGREIKFQLTFDMSSDAWARWAPTFGVMLASESFLDQARRSPHISSELGRLSATALLHAQPSTLTGLLASPARPAAPAAVRAAEHYIHDHLGEPFTVADVAAHAGVGARALHAAFRAHRGVSPMALARRLRLEHVRQRLLAASPDSTTVAQVARAWGFRHLGEFAGVYRKRFGEPPSTTLARRR